MDANAVLFDMGGMSVDSEQYWHAFEDEQVFADAIESGDPDHEEIVRMNFREIYNYPNTEYETTVMKDGFVAAYHENSESAYGEHVVLMNGAEELFSDLCAAGKKLAIVLSIPQNWIPTVRERFDLDPLDLVLSADDIDKLGKSEPHIREHATVEPDVAPEECVVIEDLIDGIEATVWSGVYTTAYRGGQDADLDLSQADRIVDGATELRAALLGEE